MAAQKSFGAACDYYRIRLIHVDENEPPDLDWRDDILYRRPPVEHTGERELWRLEAVGIDDDEDVTTLGLFDDRERAEASFASAEEGVSELTRSQFEERYFPADE